VYPELARNFLRWTLLRDALARGWWLSTALYLVVVAELTPSQLILIAVFQGITVVIAEIPAGVLADAVSRRLTLVIAHIVMGSGMSIVAFTDRFGPLVVANCLWGLGWALTSGADVAWITDELDRPDLVDRVLVAQGRARLFGTMAGLAVFGTLAWATTLAVAVCTAGVSMIGLGLVDVARWPETRFTAVAAGQRISASISILRQGTRITQADGVVGAMLASTFLVNGAADGFGRLHEFRLLDLGLPTNPDPVLWFSAVAVLGAASGAVVLRCMEARIDGRGVANRVYLAASCTGTIGLIVFAHAPNAAMAVGGALLVSGIGLPIVRVVATIVVNRRVGSSSRATAHSLLSQAENLGEICFGVALALVATGSSTRALTVSAVVLALAGLVALRGPTTH
jgi:hypothetical protein